MSGQKDIYVQIRASEHDRMMRGCRQLDEVEQKLRQAEASQSHYQESLRQQQNQANQRVESMQSAMHDMSAEMQAVETQNNQNIKKIQSELYQGLKQVDVKLQNKINQQGKKLQREINQQGKQFNQALNQQGKELRGEINRQGKQFNQALNQQGTQFNQALREQSEYQQQQIKQQGTKFNQALKQQGKQLQSKINELGSAIAQKEQGKQQRATAQLNDTQTLLKAIKQHYRHEKFQPGQLNALQYELDSVNINLQQGDYEAAISSGQQTYIRIQALRLELEQQETDWQLALSEAQHTVTETLAFCDAQAIAKITQATEDGDVELDAEIDYWVEGKLSELKQQLLNQQATLKSGEALSQQQLQENTQQAFEYEASINLYTEQAQAALIASQLRNNIGQNIEQALEDAGWAVSDASYESEDYRTALHVKLRNLSGDEMVTIITPEKTQDNSIKNKLNLSFFSKSIHDEHSIHNRLNSIITLLGDNNIDCTQPTCTPGTEGSSCQQPEKLDIEAVRNKPQTTSSKR